jgi:hypothetical protein
MQQFVAFVQNNLVLVLGGALVAVTFYALGLLTRRRHVIQILPAPVSPGLERAISAALASREIVYVSPVPSSVVEPVKRADAGALLSEAAYVGSAGGKKHALSKPEELLHELEALAAKVAHEVATALDAAAKDALLAILDHMEHHGDDAWFKEMHDKIAHAKSNADLSACAAEMLKHLHGGH